MFAKLTFISVACMSTAALLTSAKVCAADVRPAVQVQTPCMLEGHGHDQACVIVNKRISGNSPTATTTMDLSVAKVLAGKATRFSVVYAYRVQPGLNTDIGLTINRGDQSMISDIYAANPTFFWVTTRDGGKTWSKLTTTDMNSVVSY